VVLAVVSLGACGDDGATDRATVDKVTVAGDSISVGLGAMLRDELGDDVEVPVIGEPGTGLARPDSFDWPARLEQLAAEFPPDVLVLSLGSNDAQPLTAVDGSGVVALEDDTAWDDEYRRRLERSFDAFEATDTIVVWVGHVRTTDDRVGLRNRRVHRLAEDSAASRDWVVVADLADLLGSGEEVATDCLVPDGLHLSADCLQRAAQQLAGAPPIS
jgi:uncharacterized protein